ncbi:SusD family protein [Filimonas lacunae]|uniref:SusD family protein n=1 Tax=Filimonas lacunae TaxID=477680 RepID=A0A173MJF2_9BACT|nr:RagB/SusD family nutrient uptake outer membrane protein [Filimonas lacunae]BAV07541.1 hypothetical protein FLA_3567 [Filimonas lacunae]SIT30016.1 SusD family protein [Filimonas lacunae]
MMKQHLYKIAFLLTCFAFTGCSKFLDVTPSTQVVNPSTIADFQEMLNSDSLGIGNYFLTDLMSDDTYMTNNMRGSIDNSYTRSYLWQNTIWNAADVDFMYSGSYTRILQMNVILSKVTSAPADTSNTVQNRNMVIAQSLIHRSWYYLQLANIYGPAYQTTSSFTDLAVPLVLAPNAAALPYRATVQEVYSQVVSDLRTAVSNSYLPGTGKDILHPGKAAGYALLARAYLYMHNYDSALLYADSSLALVNKVTNYISGYAIPTQLVDLRNNPEILMAKIAYEQTFYKMFNNYSVRNSPSLYAYLGYYDMRYSLRFDYAGAMRTTTYNGATTIVTDFSLSTPEVLLTKAECLARKGEITGAVDIVNTIATNRVRYYVPVSASTSSEALRLVLAERRRELFMHGGLRLFDLKRLNQDAATAVDLTRKGDDSTVLATLPALSSRYVMPFTQTILANNPNITQNVRQ